MSDFAQNIDNQRDRVIRVFLSSTFRDMQAEREELIKRVFPQLRKLCEQRGVTWGEVDLRWGVTDEQKAEGKVLPICLEEIKRCRPFFIGLLGERYGWVPEEIPRHLLEQETWLEEHLTHSVTELEILHGVLNNPEMAQHAFFYFRDPAYLERLPTCANIADYQSENDTSRQKLDDLKARIRQSEFVVRESYPDPLTLGELVLRDMTDVINRLFPEGSQPDLLDREAAEHNAFAQNRAGVYIGRQEYFNRLDAHVAGDGPPLVVLGESGSGKSALLANWAIRYQQAHPDDLLIMHFIGASPYSTDWAAMLRRIMGEFKRRFNITQEIPDKPDDLRAAFANWLCIAAAKGKVILILDALNQLEDRDGAPDLVWLPPVIPPNIRLILSTLAGRSVEDLKKRAWPTLIIQPLNLDERQQFVHEYLAQYTKSLDSAPARRITEAPQTANPLYLQALLEELRVFGVFERLDERIDHYLGATTIPQLYQRILKRWEEDYETERAGMVRDALSLLWASRHGLSEAELLDLLGAEGNPLPRAIWSPFCLAVERSLVNRGGLIGFNHDYLRKAIEDEYMLNQRERQAPFKVLPSRTRGNKTYYISANANYSPHHRLATYFEKVGLGKRTIDELPWQLVRVREWKRLCDLLADPSFFVALWEADQYDVKRYWIILESNNITIKDSYNHVIETPAEFTDFKFISFLGTLLHDTGHLDESLALWASLKGHIMTDRYFMNLSDPKSDDIRPSQADQTPPYPERNVEGKTVLCMHISSPFYRVIGNEARILWMRGDIDGAMARYLLLEQISQKYGDIEGLCASLNGQALLLQDRGTVDEALKLFAETERISREHGWKEGLLASLGNQGVIHQSRGDIDGAMVLYEEQEKISRELGNMEGLQSSIGNQARIYQIRGDFNKALRLFTEQERICRELGNKAGLQMVVGNQGNILTSQGDIDNAMVLYKEQEQICRELGLQDDLQRTIGNQGVIFIKRGDKDNAMALFKEQERICRELGLQDGLQRSIGNQATIISKCGDIASAMALYREQEIICRELGNIISLSISLANQAVMAEEMGDIDNALALLIEYTQICRGIGNKEELQNALGRQAHIMKTRGDIDSATALLAEYMQIYQDIEETANAFFNSGDYAEATALYKDQETLCRRIGNKEGLCVPLWNQARTLMIQGNNDDAMVVLKEHEIICREIGNKVDLCASLGNQVSILQNRGDLDGQRLLLMEHVQICRDIGDSHQLAKSLMNLARVFHAKGQITEQFALVSEAYQIATDNGLTGLVKAITPILCRLQLLKRNRPHDE